MSIKFTKHALERMKIRNLSKEEILEIIKNPDSIVKDAYGNNIAQKLKSDFFIRVFFRRNNGDIIIITMYKTSKLKKYSN